MKTLPSDAKNLDRIQNHKFYCHSDSERWRRMSGAVAVAGAAAATGVAEARTVQISLVNEQITTGNNTFTFDLTRDGVVDMATWSAGSVYITYPYNGVNLVNNTGRLAYAWYFSGYYTGRVGGGARAGSPTPSQYTGLLPIAFGDARINGGTVTAGFADVRAFNNGVFSHSIQIIRTVFNDNGTGAPVGVVAGGRNLEFDPTIYAQRTKLASKIKKLKIKAKKNKGKKSRKLKKKRKALQMKLAAIQ